MCIAPTFNVSSFAASDSSGSESDDGASSGGSDVASDTASVASGSSDDLASVEGDDEDTAAIKRVRRRLPDMTLDEIAMALSMNGRMDGVATVSGLRRNGRGGGRRVVPRVGLHVSDRTSALDLITTAEALAEARPAVKPDDVYDSPAFLTPHAAATHGEGVMASVAGQQPSWSDENSKVLSTGHVLVTRLDGYYKRVLGHTIISWAKRLKEAKEAYGDDKTGLAQAEAAIGLSPELAVTSQQFAGALPPPESEDEANRRFRKVRCGAVALV